MSLSSFPAGRALGSGSRLAFGVVALARVRGDGGTVHVHLDLAPAALARGRVVAHQVAVPQGHRDRLDGVLQAIDVPAIAIEALQDLRPRPRLFREVEQDARVEVRSSRPGLAGDRTAGPSASASAAARPAAATAATRPPTGPAPRPSSGDAAAADRSGRSAEDAAEGEVAAETDGEDGDLRALGQLAELAPRRRAHRVHAGRDQDDRLALRRPRRDALDGLLGCVEEGGGARGLEHVQHAAEAVAVGGEVLHDVDVVVEEEDEDLVFGLEQVDEVTEGVLHLADLVLHARADVEGERDAQRPSVAAEAGDLLLAAVLRDLEVLPSEPHDRVSPLVEDGC